MIEKMRRENSNQHVMSAVPLWEFMGYVAKLRDEMQYDIEQNHSDSTIIVEDCVIVERRDPASEVRDSCQTTHLLPGRTVDKQTVRKSNSYCTPKKVDNTIDFYV